MRKFLMAAAMGLSLLTGSFVSKAEAATVTVTFDMLSGINSVASGSFQYDSSFSGVLGYGDLSSFNVLVGPQSYDLNFVNSGGFLVYHYFGFDTTTNLFVTANLGGFPQIMSAIKSGFNDGFFIRFDAGGNVARGYAAPDTGDLRFDRIAINSVTSGVPEPATWAMMLIGFAGLGFAARRRERSLAVA